MKSRKMLEKQFKGAKKRLKMDVITPNAQVSRGRKADEYIRRGFKVADAAQLAGVSEFWLQLRVDKSKIGKMKTG